jgi:hypothetical protein
MAIKFDKVQPGDTLYDCRMQKQGLRRVMATWPVRIIDKTEHGCTVSWNFNRPQFFPVRYVEKLRRNPAR